jgi:hypothetical protein
MPLPKMRLGAEKRCGKSSISMQRNADPGLKALLISALKALLISCFLRREPRRALIQHRSSPLNLFSPATNAAKSSPQLSSSSAKLPS